MTELARELEADRDADEHAEPGFLCQQGMHRAQALLLIFPSDRLANRLGVRGVEPASLGERGGKHTLQRRRRAGDQILGLAHPLRVGVRGDSRVELGVGRGVIRHVAIIRVWLWP